MCGKSVGIKEWQSALAALGIGPLGLGLRLGLLLLPHDIGVALLPGLHRHALVALLVLGGRRLPLVLFRGLLPGQVALIAPRHPAAGSDRAENH